MFTFKFPLPPPPSISPSHSGRPLVKPGSHHHPLSLPRHPSQSSSPNSLAVSSSPYHAHPSQESCCAICSSDFFTGTILPGFLSTPSHLQICRTLIQVFSPHPLFGPILRGKHLCPASDFSYFVFYDEDKTPILPLFHALTVSPWEN